MSRTLIAYATTEGQTAKVAKRLADVISGAGHEVDLEQVDALDPDADLDAYSLVVLGGSIHGGRFQQELVRFARSHREELERNRLAFFFLCLTAVEKTAEAKKGIETCLLSFVKETGLHPDPTAVFAGALAYTKYGLLKRWIMKQITKSKHGDTDTSRDYEYTDWNAVSEFGAELARIAEETPVSRPELHAAHP